MARLHHKMSRAFGCLALLMLGGALSVFAQERRAGWITGKVFDVKTREPLQNVNVFLTNTQLGDATDREGYYEIRDVPFGMYELTVSMIGYKVEARQVRVDSPVKHIENFYLSPRVLEGEEVIVTAMDPAARARFMKIFLRVFLGSSHEVLNCRLLNPEAVKLAYNDTTQTLLAFAYDPLLVENRATGYRIHFLLDHFRCTIDGTQLSFTFKGRAHFKELEPRGEVEREAWERNRLIAYHGSLRHFLTAIAAGRLYESGFNIVHTNRPTPVTALDIPKRKVRLNDILSPMPNPALRRLQFDDYLEVSYTLEGDVQTSWLQLNQGYALLDTGGTIIEPFDPTTVHGAWAYESLTEMLPRDFHPKHEAKTRPSYIADSRDYFQEGQELALAGKWEPALRSWETGSRIFEIQRKFNPKLAISFIETATANNAREYYEEACRIYYRMLDFTDVKAHKTEIIDEVERIAPLLEDEQAERWRRMARREEPELLREIKAFWLQKDPTPTTLLNERLIEHWERIAYARANFTKTKAPPYGTDDRGIIYVKYGKPDRSRALTLGIHEGIMMQWATKRDPIGQVLNALIEVGEPAATDPRQERTELRKTINKFNYFPDCEVWAYHDQLENRNVIYLFGPRGGKGSFGLRSGLEELIPDDAFHRIRTGEFRGLLPGALIQLMFYHELAAFDASFAERLNELEQAWERADVRSDFSPSISYLKSLRMQFKTRDEHDSPRLYAPKEQSDLDRKVRRVELTTIQSRILERNVPKLLFIAFAQPQILQAIRQNSDTTKLAPLSQDSLQFSLILRDSRLNTIRRIHAAPFGKEDLTTVVSITHDRNYCHYTFAIHSATGDSTLLTTRDVSQPYTIGQNHATLLPPLDSRPDKLELSDLIIGLLPPPAYDIRRLPIPIIPARHIWRGDPMQVYLEVYHLQPDKGGIGRFNLAFRVTRLQEKNGRLERREVISSAFDSQSTSETAREHFGVSVENLEAGRYELEVEVRDKQSGQKKRRQVVFDIRER